MKPMHLLSAAALAGAMTACSQLTAAPSTGCSGNDAVAVTLDIVKDEIIRRASEDVEEVPGLSKAKVRATIHQLKLSLVDVRTTKDDPDSTKQFCAGRIKLVAPPEMIQDANDARQIAGYNSVAEMAESANVEANANSFLADVDFNVQPTDDGEKTYAELENANGALGFFSELVRSHLVKSVLADAKAEQDRIAAEQHAAEEAAAREEQSAELDQAKAENKVAIERINAIWGAIPTGPRTAFTEAQKAWIRKKDAACRIEAASNATTEAEMTIARLKCDTREQSNRATELRQFATETIESGY